MIYLFTGTPGSGKSLHVAQNIYKNLVKGKNIIANFDINLDLFRGKKIADFFLVENYGLTPETFMDYCVQNHKRDKRGHYIEGQTIIVLDECQILFNSRLWNERKRLDWCSFFTQHRKYGFDIILVTQFDRLIDRQIRSLVEYEIVHRKVSNFKFLGGLIGLVCGGQLFVYVTRWYGIGEKIDHHFFKLNKKYARLYDSYKLFDDPRKKKPSTCISDAAHPGVLK